MGAISPVPFADRFYIEKVEREIIKPTIEGLKKEGINYKGFLFIGIMEIMLVASTYIPPFPYIPH